MNGWMNEWINEWMNGWMNERMNEWTNERMNEWTNEWMNEWMIEWMNDRSVIRKERKKEGKKKGKKKLMKEQLINQWINESLMDRKDWKKPATTRGGVGKVGRGGGERRDLCKDGWMSRPYKFFPVEFINLCSKWNPMRVILFCFCFGFGFAFFFCNFDLKLSTDVEFTIFLSVLSLWSCQILSIWFSFLELNVLKKVCSEYPDIQISYITLWKWKIYLI